MLAIGSTDERGQMLLSGASAGECLSPTGYLVLTTTAELHFLVPAVLRRRYPAWEDESLDGFAPAEAHVADARTLVLLGLAQLISNQAWATAEIRIVLAEDMNSFVRLECRLGEPGDGHMGLRLIPCFAPEKTDELRNLPARRNTIQWVFAGEHIYGPSGFFDESAAP